MRIEITQDFNDLEAADENDRRVVAGTKMTVTADRGTQLVDIGFAVELDTPAKKPTAAKRTKAAAPPAPAPAPQTASDPAPAHAQTATDTPAI